MLDFSENKYILIIVPRGTEEKEGKKMKWYAVQINREDDWGTGSYDLDEAIKMAKKMRDEYPETLIAVIENDTCIEEITEF